MICVNNGCMIISQYIFIMSSYQRKPFNKRRSGELLFTPRNIKSIESSRVLETEREQSSSSNRDMDLRDTLLLNGRPAIKNSLKNKSKSFLNNIKDELNTLKTEMNRIIKSEAEETISQDLGVLRNLKQSNSENNSDAEGEREEEEEVQEMWRYNMKRKPVDESSIMSDITEKRLRFFEEENGVLVAELKRTKNKYKQYKMEAEHEIMALHERLARAQNVIASNEEEFEEYKQGVEEEMVSIKKMIQNNPQALRRPHDTSITKPSVKVLEDENSALRKSLLHLKQSLLQKQRVIVSESTKIEAVLRENQKLKQQLEQMNQQFYTEIQNNTFFKCGESHINFDYSKSRIEQDESKMMFHLEDGLVRKDSGKVSGVKGAGVEQKLEELRRVNEGLMQEKSKCLQELAESHQLNEGKDAMIQDLNNEKEVLLQRILTLEADQAQTKQRVIEANTSSRPQTQKDQYITQLQTKLQTISDAHFSQLTKLKQQISSTSPSTPSNLWINDDILRQQNLQIQSLKKQLNSRNDQIQKLRHSLHTLTMQMRNTRTQLQLSNLKYIKDKKQFVGELEATIHGFRMEMEIIENVNRELGEKLRAMGEDRERKDQFIRESIEGRVEGEEEKGEVEGVFERMRIQFDNGYLKDQIFREWRMILEYREQIERMKEGGA